MEVLLELIRDNIGLDALASGEALHRISEDSSVSGHDRYWWPFFIVPVIITGIVYGRHARRVGKALSLRGFVNFCLPWKIWCRASTRVDFKLAGFNFLIRSTGLLSMVGLTVGLAATTANMVGVNLEHVDNTSLSPWTALFVAIIMAAALDFSEWLAHYGAHKIPFLWAFHRVHHSAEVMNPVTASRIHPLEVLYESIVAALIAGPIQGLIVYAFGGIDLWLLLGTNAAYALYQLTFTHLRHSHVRVRFPKPLCYIFSSPAQHHCHHSRYMRHWDMNYGELFSLWDWMFGTLYLPARDERLVLGLAPEEGVHRPRPHETLKAALIEPFQWNARRMKKVQEEAEAARLADTAVEPAS